MKAVIYERFGDINVMQVKEIPKPAPGANQVSVRVRAVSINPLDWKIRKGEMKLMSGTKFPKQIGVDFSGIVDEVGKDVTSFKKGDEVFGAVNGMKEGSLGEYALASSNLLWLKPPPISFSQAASIPIVGAGAYLAMIDIGNVSKDTEVLLNGATGGVGMFAIQLAKQRGAVVTAVGNAEGLPFAKKWGADYVVDYTKENILSRGKMYDVVFDLSGKLPFYQAKKLLKPKAVYINPVPKPIQIIATAITNLFTAQKNKILLSNPNEKAMREILNAIKQGLQIEVSKTFSFKEFAMAYKYAEKGGFIGKVAIELESA